MIFEMPLPLKGLKASLITTDTAALPLTFWPMNTGTSCVASAPPKVTSKPGPGGPGPGHLWKIHPRQVAGKGHRVDPGSRRRLGHGRVRSTRSSGHEGRLIEDIEGSAEGHREDVPRPGNRHGATHAGDGGQR